VSEEILYVGIVVLFPVAVRGEPVTRAGFVRGIARGEEEEKGLQQPLFQWLVATREEVLREHNFEWVGCHILRRRAEDYDEEGLDALINVRADLQQRFHSQELPWWELFNRSSLGDLQVAIFHGESTEETTQ